MLLQTCIRVPLHFGSYSLSLSRNIHWYLEDKSNSSWENKTEKEEALAQISMVCGRVGVAMTAGSACMIVCIFPVISHCFGFSLDGRLCACVFFYPFNYVTRWFFIWWASCSNGLHLIFMEVDITAVTDVGRQLQPVRCWVMPFCHELRFRWIISVHSWCKHRFLV